MQKGLEVMYICLNHTKLAIVSNDITLDIMLLSIPNATYNFEPMFTIQHSLFYGVPF